MKVVIVSALGNDVVRRCVNSLLETTEPSDFDLLILRERNFREKTLNAALALAGTGDDLLLVGDDILFTPGWFEALREHEKEADIWGMSMLYPGKEKVQDRGYDLASVHGRQILEPRERGAKRDQVRPFGWRYCDTVCGCFLYIRQHVFQYIRTFQEEDGANRWGEFIFTAQARKAGALTAVVDHFLYHGGVGTKEHGNKSLSSTSYQVEKDLWQRISDHYIDPAWVKIQRRTSVDAPDLAGLSFGGKKLLFYGVGTVTEALVYHLGDRKPAFDLVTGLKEEVGMEVHGAQVQDVSEIDPSVYDWIIITPLGAAEMIYSQHFLPRIDLLIDTRVSYVQAHQLPDELRYSLCDLCVEGKMDS